MRLVSFALLLGASLPSPSTAGVATHEVVQLGDQSVVAVDVKNETMDFDNSKDASTEEVVEEIVLDQEEDDEDYYEEYDEYYDEEDEQISEAFSTGVSAPAVHVADEFGSDLGKPQVIDAVIGDDVKARISDARVYIQDTVMKLPEYEPVRGLCVNKHENCAFWAEKGECEANPAFMHLNCAPVCFVCEMLHVETRCPMPEDKSLDAFLPGDLDKMFERILTDPYYQQFEPKALSRPTLAPGDTLETVNYKVGGPWMVIFDKAVTDVEADRLIELGGLEGYKRSEDVGTKQADGSYTSVRNSGRTSTNAWCNGVCYEDPIARRVMDRISNITGTPELNSEHLQLLKYEEGQFYQTHTDYIDFQLQRPSGVRILTFYIYLNDVPEGGGTNFPKADPKDRDFAVQPKKGRAALWPSVLPSNPDKKDRRTDHQALPVIQGVKYGANAWIHQRDYKTWNTKGC
mmetsp:Transcript_13726/g.26298  ORF Transcript_13726/g.26298 Transcript_13726/m.26298 type:complete len:459 (-) Transcript_13726:149-1525(-)